MIYKKKTRQKIDSKPGPCPRTQRHLRELINLIEIKKDSLPAVGLILELKGYKVMVSGKSESPIKQILELENSENPVNPEELLEKVEKLLL